MLAAAALVSAAIVPTAQAQSPAQSTAPLAIKTYSAPESSFFVSSTLVTGNTEAVLIDAQFTRAHAHRVVADILESGKKLTTVYVSAGDPDYYFGLPVIREAFPDARIVTTAAVYRHIVDSVQGKLDFWGPQLGANGISNALLPQVLKGETLTVDGERLEIKAAEGDAYHAFVWIPSLKTAVGGVDLFGPGMHVWQADAPTAAARSAWRKRLDTIESLKPVAVVPGHFVAGKHSGTQALAYTRAYLDAIETEQARAANSGALIEAMKKRYPDAQLPIALDIGAKVIKGEMKW
ncbi:MAG: MBL fold metallo-hydrolase [Burkholderiales bacterium]